MRKTNPIPSNDGFHARQRAAARLLAAGRSVPDAARELKLSRSTVWRWQRDPAFRAELRRIHERMITPAVDARRPAPPAPPPNVAPAVRRPPLSKFERTFLRDGLRSAGLGK